MAVFSFFVYLFRLTFEMVGLILAKQIVNIIRNNLREQNMLNYFSTIIRKIIKHFFLN